MINSYMDCASTATKFKEDKRIIHSLLFDYIFIVARKMVKN